MKLSHRIALVSSVLSVGLMAGCAALQPGADPIVVRSEQTLTIAQATFDTFLKIDDANRGFFKTNAPAIHNAAEWLRVQVPFSTSNTNLVARWAAMVESAELTKLAYKKNRTPDNKASLVTALAVLEQAVIQAQQQLTAINLKP